MNCRWPISKLGDLCEIHRGGSPRPIDQFITEAPDGINWIKIGDVGEGEKYVLRTMQRIRPEGAQRSRFVECGDFLLTNSMSYGRPYILRTSGCIHDGWLVLRYDKEKLSEDYLYHALSSGAVHSQFVKLASGAVVKNLNSEVVKSVEIPLPPLFEQRRIAAILDKADALRTRRREALAQLDRLAQSIFVEMFGDPATNPKGWPWRTLGSLAKKFSDGPFGSNLKSEHYVESGVRVVRLQNIGAGDFIDDDKAYISEEHFEKIAKHECVPGDILVGTLGDPNLRACFLPPYIPLAINKADCVQIRVEEREAHVAFVCALLNHPSTQALAQSLMHGQTRVRISMGSLRELEIPVPPLILQREFAERVRRLDLTKEDQRISATALNTLFASLQQRAFAGQL